MHVGLRQDVETADLAALVERQDATTLLGLLHEAEVAAGDVVWVPPGELHAIGAGVLLLELQQPEDLSILLEWHGFAIDGAAVGHLGLGFDRALAAVTTTARSATDLAALVSTAPESGSAFPSAADEYFRLERIPLSGSAHLDRGFSVLIVSAGEVAVDGRTHPAGTTLLVPDSAGALDVTGHGELLVARPPAP